MHYLRFNIHQRLQHFLMGASFIFLALTGLPIKYHQANISLKIADFFGGYDGLMFVHKLNAAIMLITAAYHIFFLLYYFIVKKQVSWAMVPTLQDGKDIVACVKYSLGLIKEQPQYDRYSWKEKFDYLAVFWGMLAIGATGLFMWFPDSITQFVPRWVIDSCRMAHSDEAVLAVTFIAFVHFYNVHFCADIFPMNKVWLIGKMTREEMMHEHPLELERLDRQNGITNSYNIELPPGSINHSEDAATIDEGYVHKEHTSWKHSRPLLITEFIIWGAILVWFVTTFAPDIFH